MDSAIAKQKAFIYGLLKKNFLVSKEFIDYITEDTDIDRINSLLENADSLNDILVLDSEFESYILKNISGINWSQMETFKAWHEKKKDSKGYENFKKFIFELNKINPITDKTSSINNDSTTSDPAVFSYQNRTNTKSINSISSIYNNNNADGLDFFSRIRISQEYNENLKKREVNDFVAYFNHRLNNIASILRNRSELSNVLSISRVLNKSDRDTVAVIGIVREKEVRDTNVVIYLEDSTGEIKIIVSINKRELYELSKNVVLDEVIGVVGVCGKGVIFANEILWPDIPFSKELKKGDEEVYAVFLSDIHVGSKKFLPREFNCFLKWLNGEFGSATLRDLAKKVGYIFIIGDLVDGVGIYPAQESELDIKDIAGQYNECAVFLSLIPKHIPVIICPGNHDALRISEPQPRLPKEYAKSLWNLPNVIMVTNPCVVSIEVKEGFSGFDVLMYHGYSFDHYVANVDVIRSKGGYDRADLIMKFLLQRRHLAPTHTSTLYIPDNKDDPLFIRKVPDFFVTGHIHKSYVSRYRNVDLICGSCWQSKTTFQEKVGHNPEPARVPVVNLKTRAVKILNFDVDSSKLSSVTAAVSGQSSQGSDGSNVLKGVETEV